MNKEIKLKDASLQDVTDWFIETYPEDIFDGSSKDVGAIAIKHILQIVKEIRK